MEFGFNVADVTNAVTTRPHRHVKEGKGSLSVLYSAYYELLICRRSGMARVNEGSHNFTCHPHVYPQVERTIPAFI